MGGWNLRRPVLRTARGSHRQPRTKEHDDGLEIPFALLRQRIRNRCGDSVQPILQSGVGQLALGTVLAAVGGGVGRRDEADGRGLFPDASQMGMRRCTSASQRRWKFKATFVDCPDAELWADLQTAAHAELSDQIRADHIRSVFSRVDNCPVRDVRIAALQTVVKAGRKLLHDDSGLVLRVQSQCAHYRSTKSHTLPIEAKHGHLSKLMTLRAAPGAKGMSLRGGVQQRTGQEENVRKLRGRQNQ